MIIPAELGYPAKGDPDHNIVGTKFRALWPENVLGLTQIKIHEIIWKMR